MVNSVSSPQIISKINGSDKSDKSKTTRTSIFYLNDEHSQIANMERLKSASDEFDAFVPSENTDKLKFSAGDFALGPGIPLNKLAVIAQNAMGIMATAGGNHEFDPLKKDLTSILTNNNYKILGLNVNIPETTPENKELKKDVTTSYIQEQNGTKYGVIGLFPFDFIDHVTYKKEYPDFEILPLEKTIPLVQKEINKLKEQGVNKIIVLSHTGYNNDIKLAQSVEGIDVIIGGHTHDLIKGIEEGKNLFYSKKTGEPTIITQAGKDGNYFGVLNLEFNENGVITKAQNNVSKTDVFPKSSIIRFFTDKILGKPAVIGVINSAPNEIPSLVKENPTANLINDAVKSELNVDIVMMNSANLRSNFEAGTLTDRDLVSITPFKNKMCIVKLTEKELVDAIKNGAKSLADVDSMPGLAQFSGVKYTMTKTGEVKSVTVLGKDGREVQIDINNPSQTKSYRVAMDDFVLRGGNGYISDKTDIAEAKFDFTKDKLVIDYLKKLNKPVDIKADGRIKIID